MFTLCLGCVELHLVWLHSTSFPGSLWGCSISSQLHVSTALSMIVSSAKSRLFELMSGRISSIKSRNSIGLSTDLWGTSEVTGMLSELDPSTTTRCERSLIQERFLPLIPYQSSSTRSLPCDNLSKALLKSITMQPTCLLVKNIEWRSWLKSMSWASHDRPSRKPCCCEMKMPRSLRAHFLSLAQTKLRLCWANHRPGYWGNLPCDWPSIAWAYSEQETENGPRCLFSWLTMMCSDIMSTHMLKIPACS